MYFFNQTSRHQKFDVSEIEEVILLCPTVQEFFPSKN